MSDGLEFPSAEDYVTRDRATRLADIRRGLEGAARHLGLFGFSGLCPYLYKGEL